MFVNYLSLVLISFRRWDQNEIFTNKGVRLFILHIIIFACCVAQSTLFYPPTECFLSYLITFNNNYHRLRKCPSVPQLAHRTGLTIIV